MASKVEEPPRVTPFRVFVRELKKQKLEFVGCVLAAGCVALSVTLVGMKKGRQALEAEHEQRMIDLQSDNKELRSQLEEIQRRVMAEAEKTGRKVEPLHTRLGKVFDEFFPPAFEESGKQTGKFFV